MSVKYVKKPEEDKAATLLKDKILKSPEVKMYELSDRASFYVITKTLDLGDQKAFERIAEEIKAKGAMTRDEIREIYKQYTPTYIVRGGPQAFDKQLDEILKAFVDGGGLKEAKIAEKEAEKTIVPEKAVSDSRVPVTYLKKPENKELVNWLIKEFKMSGSDAGMWTFSSTPDQQELIVPLKKMMPEAPLETLNKLLKEVPADTLRKNLATLEEYDVPPAQLIAFLRENPLELEASTGRPRKYQKDVTKKMLEHIKKSCGVGSINSETIGKVREELSNWTSRNPKRAEAVEIGEKYLYFVQNVLRENPSYRIKRLLHEIYSFDEKEVTMDKLLNRAGASYGGNLPVFLIMDELELIKRSPASFRYTGGYFYTKPMKITWKNKEEMKKIWPHIEEWGESMGAPDKIKIRKQHGELLNQAIEILGKKSIEELTEADIPNIKNLTRTDWKLKGMEVATKGSMQGVKRRLLEHVALNKSPVEIKRFSKRSFEELTEDDTKNIKNLDKIRLKRMRMGMKRQGAIGEEKVAVPKPEPQVSSTLEGGYKERIPLILERTKQKILQYIEEHPDRVVRVPDERFGEIKVVRLPSNLHKYLAETKGTIPDALKDVGRTKATDRNEVSYALMALEREGKHMFFYDGEVGSYTQGRKPVTELQAKVLNACFDPDTGEYIKLPNWKIAAKTGLIPQVISGAIFSLEMRGYIFKSKEELEPAK